MTPLQNKITQTAILGSFLSSPCLFGAGFQLAERSASGMGRAYSGESAIADDASVLASNPAAMILLGGNWNYSVGASYIRPGVDVQGFSPAIGVGGPTLTPANDKGVINEALVPYTYLTRRIHEDIVLGMGIYTTYGLRTEYSRDFADLAATQYSELFSFNVNPAIAYRLNDIVTLGAGLDIFYTSGQLNSQTPLAIRQINSLPAGTLFNLEGDDIAFGYNIGALFEFSENTRLGIHYRSSINLDVEGHADVGPALAGTAFGRYDASLEIEMPDSFEISLYQKINDRFAIHGDILWTNWSKFETLSPTVSTGSAALDSNINSSISTDENWDDAFRYSLGATWQPQDKLTLRCGVAYDTSPVGDSNRTLRIPDGDRLWLSLGATYHLSESYNIDFGYTHIFTDSVTVGDNEAAFSGEVGGDVDLLSLGVSGSF